MKTKLFFLLLFLFSGYCANSQITVKLDSVSEGWGEDTLMFYRKISIFSTVDIVDDSIIEKGIFMCRPDGLSSLLMLSGQGFVNTDSLYLPINNTDFDTTVYFIPNLQWITLQSYVVTNNGIIYSDEIIDLHLPIIGLEDIEDDNMQVTIYPTLVDNMLNIESSQYPLCLSIVDVSGREVFSKIILSYQSINCNNLKRGIYYCIFRSKEKNVYKKMIKI